MGGSIDGGRLERSRPSGDDEDGAEDRRLGMRHQHLHPTLRVDDVVQGVEHVGGEPVEAQVQTLGDERGGGRGGNYFFFIGQSVEHRFKPWGQKEEMEEEEEDEVYTYCI